MILSRDPTQDLPATELKDVTSTGQIKSEDPFKPEANQGMSDVSLDSCEQYDLLTPQVGFYFAYRTEEGTGRLIPSTVFTYYKHKTKGWQIHTPNNFDDVPSVPYEWDVYKNMLFSCKTVDLTEARKRFQTGSLVPEGVAIHEEMFEFMITAPE